MARISAEQVLTGDVLTQARIGFPEHSLATESARRGGTAHIYVKDGRLIPAAESRPSRAPKATRRKRGRPKKRGRPRKPRKGGWQTTKYISHELRRDTYRKAALLQCAGYPFTVLVTVRPPAIMPDAQAKRYIGLQLAHLGQALNRSDHPYIGLSAFEKKHGLLHAHTPMHVRHEQMHIVKSWADRFDAKHLEPSERGPSVERHARPYVSSDMQYVTKQHRWCGADFETSVVAP